MQLVFFVYFFILYVVVEKLIDFIDIIVRNNLAERVDMNIKIFDAVAHLDRFVFGGFGGVIFPIHIGLVFVEVLQ